MEKFVQGVNYGINFFYLHLDNVLKITGLLFTTVILGLVGYGIFRLGQKEKEIFIVKNQIDNIENDNESKRILHSGMVNQSQFEKMTEVRKKPLLAKLETLKLERQYLLEKIPLLSLFKK